MISATAPVMTTQRILRLLMPLPAWSLRRSLWQTRALACCGALLPTKEWLVHVEAGAPPADGWAGGR